MSCEERDWNNWTIDALDLSIALARLLENTGYKLIFYLLRDSPRTVTDALSSQMTDSQMRALVTNYNLEGITREHLTPLLNELLREINEALEVYSYSVGCSRQTESNVNLH